MTFQTRLILSIASILILAFLLLQYDTFRHTTSDGEEQLQQKAEEIRGVLMSMRRVYHKQFLNSDILLSEKTVGFLPAHAMNRISAEFSNWSDTGLSFNNVSQKPRNPNQNADAIELKAIQFFEQNRQKKLLFTPYDNKAGEPYYLYARPIWIEKYCLKCHGERSKAPETIQKLYPTAFDYQVGDLRGILSIKLPAKTIQNKTTEHFWHQLQINAIGLFILLVSIFFLVQYYLARPLKKITTGMKSVTEDAFHHKLRGLQGEFAEPAHIFNQMSSKIIEQRQDLQEMVNSLDNKVKERTSELDNKISELTKTRNELIQSEKMASLGRLVGGFAHEINTPIGVAVSASSFLEENARTIKHLLAQEEVTEEELLACSEPIEEAAKLTQSNLRRAAKLVASFKRTAIDQSNETSHLFDVAESISDVINSLRNKFKRTQIKINIKCPEKLSLYGNPGDLEQLLTNLMFNSLVHGFNNGEEQGSIHIEVKQVKKIFQLEYSDNGKGMDITHLDRIFEPFFTTNRTHGGSGLGLYICYNLVTINLKGTIHCDSRPNQGVYFLIQFPIQHPIQHQFPIQHPIQHPIQQQDKDE